MHSRIKSDNFDEEHFGLLILDIEDGFGAVFGVRLGIADYM
jgi:hypothetical protein